MKVLLSISLAVLVALIFDLGNPDALRQGTEGFYLQVASEMHGKGSLLTPYYLGNPHWSKPPLLFIIPQFFYLLEGFPSLFSSRLAVLILGVFLTALSSFKISKITNINPSSFFLFVFSTVGFFKYSRIFMMEMPLLILGFLSAIYFFSYLESRTKSDFLYSVLFSTLCCLTKGPVSFVMLIPSFCLYSFYHFLVFKEIYLKEIVLWSLASIFLSSFWFLYEYKTFGDPFFEYFFLRENLGKFSSKSYPIIHVFQGLFLYSLPWSFLIPGLIWRLKSSGVEKLSSSKSKFIVFLLICFSCFFSVWLIPQQRSHHYALPAIPFLLLIIYLEYFSDRPLSKAISRFYKTYLSAFSILGLFIVLVTFYFKDQFVQSNVYSLITGMILLIGSLILVFRKSVKKEHFFISGTILITVFWSLFIPNYILPLVPENVRKAAESIKNIGAVHRKPYFISQSLGRNIDILGLDDVNKFLTKKETAVIIDGPLFRLLEKSSNYQILKDWKVWKRGLKPYVIFQNIKDGSIDKMRSKMFLIKSN